MDFRLTPEEEEFRRAVARFVDAEVAPVAREIDEAGEFPRALFRRLGEQGYLALRYPEAYGGADADFLTYCLFAAPDPRDADPVPDVEAHLLQPAGGGGSLSATHTRATSIPRYRERRPARTWPRVPCPRPISSARRPRRSSLRT